MLDLTGLETCLLLHARTTAAQQKPTRTLLLLAAASCVPLHHASGCVKGRNKVGQLITTTTALHHLATAPQVVQLTAHESIQATHTAMTRGPSPCTHLVELLTGPVHDVAVHAVLHSQHAAGPITQAALQALKQRAGQAGFSCSIAQHGWRQLQVVTWGHSRNQYTGSFAAGTPRAQTNTVQL